MKKFLLSAVIALSVTAPAYAASGNTSTATGQASAVVVSPIVLTHTASATLNFGSFTTGTGGSVVVTSGGAGSVTGDVGFVPSSVNAADAFTVAGDNSRAFSIATTGGTITDGSSSMTFTTTPSAASGTTSSTGAAAFTVGGTLTVGTGLVAGTYTGSYSATVAYD
jgi:hypothetical protein